MKNRAFVSCVTSTPHPPSPASFPAAVPSLPSPPSRNERTTTLHDMICCVWYSDLWVILGIKFLAEEECTHTQRDDDDLTGWPNPQLFSLHRQTLHFTATFLDSTATFKFGHTSAQFNRNKFGHKLHTHLMNWWWTRCGGFDNSLLFPNDSSELLLTIITVFGQWQCQSMRYLFPELATTTGVHVTSCCCCYYCSVCHERQQLE